MAHGQQGTAGGAQWDLLTLDEEGVASFFASLGYPYYAEQLKEHGISGPILLHLDHTSLRDLGIISVGQRLAILRAVWQLKVEQNITIVGSETGEGDEGGMGNGFGAGGNLEEALFYESSDAARANRGPSSQILGLLGERDDRIHSLELQVQQLHDTLTSLREDILRPTSSAPKMMTPRPAIRSPTFANNPQSNGSGPSVLPHPPPPPPPPAASSSSHILIPNPHPLSNQSTLSRANSTSTSKVPYVSGSTPAPGNSSSSNGALSPSLASSSFLPDSPRSPIIIDSPRLGSHLNGGGAGGGGGGGSETPLTPTTPTAPPPPPYNLSLSVPGSSSGSRPGSSTTTTTTTEGAGAGSSTPASAPSTASSGGRGELGLGAPPSASRERERHRDVSSSSTLTTGSHHEKDDAGRREKEKEKEKDKENPYRSFRVTVDDPCHKVLPAALKKYKINDDWRQYALFICYGNTERCLAYDEKPLLLFQRLKESNNNPVFMLRHIKDIKSPIAVASAKHAARRSAGEKRAVGVGAGTEERKTVNRDGVAVQQQPTARPTRLHHPPVLLPVGKGKDKEGEKKDAQSGGEDVGAAPPMSPREAPGYCISIYPYLAEREDEFDVTVGDTFVIISKTKGWWVVHRDLGPLHQLDSTTPRKSAWVPAGCLLETSVPPLSLAPASLDISSLPPGNAATVPIEPQYVVSVSTPNVALMDYAKQGSDELEVKKGTNLRILKRYNHWSYAIKEDGQRGWIPSWFCGRAARAGDGTPTTPTTAEGRSALSASLSSSTGRDRSTSSSSTAAVGSTSNPAAAVVTSTTQLQPPIASSVNGSSPGLSGLEAEAD